MNRLKLIPAKAKVDEKRATREETSAMIERVLLDALIMHSALMKKILEAKTQKDLDALHFEIYKAKLLFGPDGLMMPLFEAYRLFSANEA